MNEKAVSTTMQCEQPYDVSASSVDEIDGGLEDRSAIDEAHTVENTAAVASTSTIPIRVPYDNGYGDFYFGKMPYSQRDYTYKITNVITDEEKLELRGITGSNGVPVVELDGFQRSGKFRYMDLPFEIREKILRMLLAPVLCSYHDGDTVVEFTRFTVSTQPDPFPEDMYSYDSEDTYEQSVRSAARAYKAACYPGRELLYHINLYPVRPGCTHGPTIDYLFLEWLRQASHVSTTFRHELALVLWAHTVIQDSEGDGDNHEAIWAFLYSRPAVHNGVDLLYVNLSISRGQDIDHPLGFGTWCDYIAKTLSLEQVFFKISVCESDLKRLMEGKKCGLEDLALASKLRVSENFEVTLERFMAYDGDDDEDGPQDDGSDVEVWEEPIDPVYHHLVEDLMWPDTLKISEPETKEEKYLQARVAEDTPH